MALSTQYPYYGPLGKGNYNVSLAYFGSQSEISKSIGSTSSTALLTPNVNYIQQFANGDLGIARSFKEDMIFKNINSKSSTNNVDVFKHFAKLNNINTDDISKYKKGNKYSLPKSAINVSKDDRDGFGAFERTVLQSIFESQKPFMEIVKIVSETISQ